MKIRNGFVSNSSSSSFVVAFNPNYNMKGKKKVDEFGDSPFNKIIELYGQKDYIQDSADALIKFYCDNEGIDLEELKDICGDKIEKIEIAKDTIPANWHWAEVAQPEGTASKIGGIIDGMADCNYADIFDDYDFNNGYMIVIYKG